MPRQCASSPPEGAAFAVPLEDGRYTACRVILGADHERAREEGGSVLVATAAWIGETLPSAADPQVRKILWRTQHKPRRRSLHWMLDALPKSFVPIGTIRPTAAERRLECCVSCVWEGIATDALLEWRWQHDREGLLAEIEAEKAASQRQAELQRQQPRRRVSLSQLARRKFFASWRGFVDAARIRQSQQIMARTIAALEKLGRQGSEAKKLKILQKCIEQFNAADARQQFIDTVEREDICEAFYLVCCACGLGDQEDLADRWRDW